VITAVDTNVLLDVLGADATFGPRSAEALRRCIAEGGVLACEVVWAETGASFEDASTAETSLTAGRAWRSYRKAGGARERVIADFLIGAHASHRADRLLSRDRGFYRRYFDELRVLDPSED
jgi:predicted nucleic acid-binding protein